VGNDQAVEIKFLVTGDAAISKVVIEPWAEEVKLLPGTAVEVHAQGPRDGVSIEIDVRNGVLALWGWPGSRMDISLK